jgi:predicted outer membrane protein
MLRPVHVGFPQDIDRYTSIMNMLTRLAKKDLTGPNKQDVAANHKPSGQVLVELVENVENDEADE